MPHPTAARSTPYVIGVSGHRDLSPQDIPRIRKDVAEFLRELRVHLPDTELRVMAGMAVGADLLVAETALELGIGVDAVLPMTLEEYASDFDPESLERLHALLADERVRRIELPAPQGTRCIERDELYSNLTRALTRTCNLLLAVWDGASSVLPGGTADTVLRYLGVRTDRNPREVGFAFADAPADQHPPFRLVYWIPASRGGQQPVAPAEVSCFLSGLGDNVLQRWPGLPSQLASQLAQLNEYNREYRQLLESGAGVADSLLKGLPASLPVPPHARRTLEQIDAQYGKADALAVYFQNRSDRLFTFFSLMAFVMGLAYLAYEKFFAARVLLLVYLMILLLSLGLYYMLHGRRWFAKHLMCRALAETLRAKFYLTLAGADHLVDAEEVISLSGIDRFHGFSWIGHVLTSFEEPAGEIPAHEHEDARHLDEVDAAWIDSQRRYFVGKVARLERSNLRTARLKRVLFAVILLVMMSLILLGDSAHDLRLGSVSLHSVLTFTMGLLAVGLGIWELHQNKMATRELLWQYRNQLEHFSVARTQLARTTSGGRRRQILADLGKDSLMESYLWTIHRYHREHEPPGRS